MRSLEKSFTLTIHFVINLIGDDWAEKYGICLGQRWWLAHFHSPELLLCHERFTQAFVLRSVNIVLAECESSAQLRYKKHGEKRSRAGLTSRRTPRMSLLSTSEGKARSRGGIQQKGRDARERLKGLGLAKVIGIPVQFASWLWSKGKELAAKPEGKTHSHLQCTKYLVNAQTLPHTWTARSNPQIYTYTGVNIQWTVAATDGMTLNFQEIGSEARLLVNVAVKPCIVAAMNNNYTANISNSPVGLCLQLKYRPTMNTLILNWKDLSNHLHLKADHVTKLPQQVPAWKATKNMMMSTEASVRFYWSYGTCHD